MHDQRKPYTYQQLLDLAKEHGLDATPEGLEKERERLRQRIRMLEILENMLRMVREIEEEE